jgi:hypothetical protein
MEKIRMRRILILSLLILVFSHVMTQPAMACSGGPAPWNDWLPMLLERTDVVVTGSYVRLDDLGVNGIFRVDKYVVGTGSEYLLIQAISHEFIENALFTHRYLSSCGGPSIHNVLSEQAKYTYFLTRGRDGIYSITHSRSFPNSQSTTSIWDRDRGEVKLTTSAFHAQIATVAGTQLRTPDSDTFQPRTTPILLTTERGQHYLLPVDTTVLVPIPDDEVVDIRRDQTQCGPPPCTVYSPNQLDKVYLQSSSEAPNLNLGISTVVESVAVGERIVFSATSDTYALWHDDQIHIHALWYPALGYPTNPQSGMYEPSESLNATLSGDSTDYPVAWSPDGRTLAFSTEDGLWLWDALITGSLPELLLPVGDHVPVVRYFSPMGRYIAITDGTRHFTLDLVTRNELPDGVVSPNDRVLLAHDMVSDEPWSIDVIYLAPGPRQFAYYPEVEYRHVQWIDNENFVASISGFSYTEWLPAEPYQDSSGEWVYEAFPHLVEEPFVAVSTYHSSGIYSGQSVPMNLPEIQMRDFTYTPGPGLIEISAEGYHLNMRGGMVDLTSQLPDPIESAVWLPYGFYFETD